MEGGGGRGMITLLWIILIVFTALFLAFLFRKWQPSRLDISLLLLLVIVDILVYLSREG